MRVKSGERRGKGRGTAGGAVRRVVGGLWFHVSRMRGAILDREGGRRGTVSKGGVAGGIPPHKGSRLRLTVQKRGERSEE